MSIDRFLRGLSPKEEKRIRSFLVARRFGPNEVVFHQGDVGRELHIVNRGHFLIQTLSQSGHETAIRVSGPGDVFGEMALLGKEAKRNATIRTVEKASTLVLDVPSLEQLRREAIAIDRLLIEVLISKIDQHSLRQMELTELSAADRVVRRLVELIDVYPSGRIGLPQAQIASMCSTTRATVSTTLRGLRECGVVVQEGHTLAVVDQDALRARAAEL